MQGKLILLYVSFNFKNRLHACGFYCQYRFIDDNLIDVTHDNWNTIQKIYLYDDRIRYIKDHWQGVSLVEFAQISSTSVGEDNYYRPVLWVLSYQHRRFQDSTLFQLPMSIFVTICECFCWCLNIPICRLINVHSTRQAKPLDIAQLRPKMAGHIKWLGNQVKDFPSLQIRTWNFAYYDERVSSCLQQLMGLKPKTNL